MLKKLNRDLRSGSRNRENKKRKRGETVTYTKANIQKAHVKHANIRLEPIKLIASRETEIRKLLV